MLSVSTMEQNIHLSNKKISYSISHGLRPYFFKQISDEFKATSPFFSFMFDETLNDENLKQLDIFVRYWCEKIGISEKYIGSKLLGYASAP